MPPSKGVPSGPCIRASHTNMSSSLTGPAVIPSGGFVDSALYSPRRRRWAVLDAMEYNLLVMIDQDR